MDCRGETRRHQRQQLALGGEKCGQLVSTEVKRLVLGETILGQWSGPHHCRWRGVLSGRGKGQQQEGEDHGLLRMEPRPDVQR